MISDQPGTQPTYPGPPQDYWKEISGLMQQQLQNQAQLLNVEYKKQLDAEIPKIRETLQKEAAGRIRGVVLAAVAAIVAGFSLLVYIETRSLTETSSGFQNAVMGLQKEVVATANGLGEKVSLIAAANRELELSVRQVESTRKELQNLIDAVAKTRSELDTAKRAITATTSEYETRLKALRQAGPRKDGT